MKNTKLEFSNISEAREVLIAMKNANKNILKKNPDLYEDYSILVGANYCVLEYSITQKEELI